MYEIIRGIEDQQTYRFYYDLTGKITFWDWQDIAFAAERMQQRGMTQKIVNDIVENGKVLSQNNGSKFAYIITDGVVIVSNEGKLITAWSSADFDSNMLDIIDKLFGK